MPRYRQRLAYVPLGQGRPVWADDPHFNPYYHIRHTALPKPADEAALKRLAGRLFSQRLDRSKPLWEIWLVQNISGGRFALIAKTHHALVDGVSGVDITTVLFDTAREPAAHRAAAAVERQAAARPREAARRGADRTHDRPRRDGARRPRAAARAAQSRRAAQGRAGEHRRHDARGDQRAGAAEPVQRATIGPHRRYTFLDADLGTFKEIKDSLGGTLNDVVLASVCLALGRYLRERRPRHRRSRAEGDGAGIGAHQGAARRARQPGRRDVGAAAGRRREPGRVPHKIAAAMEDLKKSGQAVGAQVLTNLAGFAPPTILSQAARLQARQPFFNLVVTNVPGPQFPLYLLGRRLEVLYPVVPLAQRQALGIAVMSYDGHLGFGLLGDYDALPGLEKLALDLEWAIGALARAAGVGPRPAPRAKTRKTASRAASTRGRTAEIRRQELTPNAGLS